jgi:UDP-GlcNAc:undecaprenyl-phosphate GlcNAc-1-phosphate transferase
LPLSAALPLLLLGLPIMDTLTVMLTRIRAGRSPFSADSNHLHHRLLALGFAHREAVLLIYLMQVALVLLAYACGSSRTPKSSSPSVCLPGVVLGVCAGRTQVGWRLKYLGQKSSGVRRYINGFTPAARIPAFALGVMTTCLAVYATTVLARAGTSTRDLGLMCLAMLIVLLLLSLWKAQRSLQWFERTATYISVVLLVYLDQTMPNKPLLLTTLVLDLRRHNRSGGAGTFLVVADSAVRAHNTRSHRSVHRTGAAEPAGVHRLAERPPGRHREGRHSALCR